MSFATYKVKRPLDGVISDSRKSRNAITASEETEVLLIEPDGTPNTGDAGGEMTAEPRKL